MPLPELPTTGVPLGSAKAEMAKRLETRRAAREKGGTLTKAKSNEQLVSDPPKPPPLQSIQKSSDHLQVQDSEEKAATSPLHYVYFNSDDEIRRSEDGNLNVGVEAGGKGQEAEKEIVHRPSPSPAISSADTSQQSAKEIHGAAISQLNDAQSKTSTRPTAKPPRIEVPTTQTFIYPTKGAQSAVIPARAPPAIPAGPKSAPAKLYLTNPWDSDVVILDEEEEKAAAAEFYAKHAHLTVQSTIDEGPEPVEEDFSYLLDRGESQPQYAMGNGWDQDEDIPSGEKKGEEVMIKMQQPELQPTPSIPMPPQRPPDVKGPTKAKIVAPTVTGKAGNKQQDAQGLRHHSTSPHDNPSKSDTSTPIKFTVPAAPSAPPTQARQPSPQKAAANNKDTGILTNAYVEQKPSALSPTADFAKKAETKGQAPAGTQGLTKPIQTIGKPVARQSTIPGGTTVVTSELRAKFLAKQLERDKTAALGECETRSLDRPMAGGRSSPEPAHMLNDAQSKLQPAPNKASSEAVLNTTAPTPGTLTRKPTVGAKPPPPAKPAHLTLARQQSQTEAQQQPLPPQQQQSQPQSASSETTRPPPPTGYPLTDKFLSQRLVSDVDSFFQQLEDMITSSDLTLHPQSHPASTSASTTFKHNDKSLDSSFPSIPYLKNTPPPSTSAETISSHDPTSPTSTPPPTSATSTPTSLRRSSSLPSVHHSPLHKRGSSFDPQRLFAKLKSGSKREGVIGSPLTGDASKKEKGQKEFKEAEVLEKVMGLW
ncbi:hypothetical protein HDV00_001448 [Rhizophlyctis rosea]|nr:hypothetical protein HDV00_001448 [Rhizophlyctis rosea]